LGSPFSFVSPAPLEALLPLTKAKHFDYAHAIFCFDVMAVIWHWALVSLALAKAARTSP
jgi:hypothetical protein